MSLIRPTALFFHGLNTFKDDLLHLGPVNLGRMDRFIKPALESRGISFYSIDGIGFGSPESQARHASKEIAKFDLKKGQTVSLLGNSMGGIVARAVAKLWRDEPFSNPLQLKVEKLISWGSPHFGSVAATWSFTKNHATFQYYSPTALEKFNQAHPENAVAPEYYFLCAANWREVSPYFWGIYSVIHGLRPEGAAPSDGFIPAKSQMWGESRGTFALDHFGQTGFDLILPRLKQRERSRREFEKLCDAMSTLIKES